MLCWLRIPYNHNGALSSKLIWAEEYTPLQSKSLCIYIYIHIPTRSNQGIFALLKENNLITWDLLIFEFLRSISSYFFCPWRPCTWRASPKVLPGVQIAADFFCCAPGSKISPCLFLPNITSHKHVILKFNSSLPKRPVETKQKKIEAAPIFQSRSWRCFFPDIKKKKQRSSDRPSVAGKKKCHRSASEDKQKKTTKTWSVYIISYLFCFYMSFLFQSCHNPKHSEFNSPGSSCRKKSAWRSSGNLSSSAIL